MQATKTLALLTRALCSACIVYSTAATAALVALHRCFAVLQYLGIQPAAAVVSPTRVRVRPLTSAVTHACVRHLAMDTISLNVPTLQVVGMAAAAGLLACKLIASRNDNDGARGSPPAWLDELEDDESYERVRLPEWDNGTEWRRKNGFKGSDYVHDACAAVHVPRYYLRGVAGGVGSKLVGAAHFGPGAESHRGLCHGGTMCALMDDVVGWTGFCATGVCKPWSGFTVQINTALKKPVDVGSWLRLEGEIVKVEGRKVSVRARLLSADGAIHCEAEGLVVLKKS